MFTELRKLSLESAVEIMRLKLDPGHKSFDKLLARKTAILSAVVSATTRIDQTVLRGRERDKFSELLEEVQREEARKAN